MATALSFKVESGDNPTPVFEDNQGSRLTVGVTNGQFNVAPSTTAFEDDSLSIKKSENSSAEVSGVAKAFVSTAEPQAPQELQISLPANLAATENGALTIPVTLTNNNGAQVSAFSFDVKFNPAFLQLSGAAIDAEATLSNNCFAEANRESRGRVAVAGACANGIAPSSGTLINLRFTVVKRTGNADDESGALTFQQIPIFEDRNGNRIAVGKVNGGGR